MTKSENIYALTLRRLREQKAARCIFEDKHLLLLFVQLERAKQSKDFHLVKSAVDRINLHLRRRNLLKYLVYAFQFVAFYDNSRSKTSFEVDGTGGITWKFWYSRKISEQEHLIRQWAWFHYEQSRKNHIRAYRSEHRDKMKASKSSLQPPSQKCSAQP